MRFVPALLIAACTFLAVPDPAVAYPLTLEQRERLDRYIPRSFAKLEAHDPVHVVMLGDSLIGGFSPLKSAWESNNPLYSFGGVFLSQLARDFFYPGGVRLLNPPPNGNEKLTDLLGSEITLENLTHIDAVALDGLRHATTDAFLHDPDLLLIQYGIYDAFENVPIDAYKRSLQEIIDAGKRERADMIVFSPGLVNSGKGEIPWGITRPYASAAREVAAANGVLFIDIGNRLARRGGGVDPDNHPKAAMEIVSDRLSRIFHFGPDLARRERVHPEIRIQQAVGEEAYFELKDGPPAGKFTFAGVASYENPGLVTVTMAVRNQTDEPQAGTIGALAVGGAFLPRETAQRFAVPAGSTTQLTFQYTRPVVGKTRDGADLFYPVEPTDEFARFSYMLEDSVGSQLVDLPLRVGPVTALWKSRQFINVGDKLRIEWDLVNGTDKAIAGTFRVGMADRIGEPASFSVSPLGTKTVFSVFDFEAPGDQAQFQRDVWIQIEVGGKAVRFTREMEATRDLVLGEEMPMQSWTSYANAAPEGDGAARMRSSGGASVRFDADQDALYIVARMEGIEIPDLGDRAALQAKLFLDARPVNEVRSFGVVEPVEIYTRGADGPGTTAVLELGSFGNGYNMILNPIGVTSVLSTSGDGARLLEMRVPRKYLHRHEWQLDNIDSLLGVRLELTPADDDANAANPFPSHNRYETSSATFAHDGSAIYGFNESDARSLSTLRLTRQPVESWSVRIY